MVSIYLSNRHLRVTAQGSRSSPDEIKSSYVGMFADHTKLFKNIKSTLVSAKLQSNLRHLETWSEDSEVNFNEIKCNTQCLRT